MNNNTSKINIPEYNSYCFIYMNNNIIGYTNTNKEANNICKINNRYQWDYNNSVKNIDDRIDLYNILPQLVISDDIIIEN
jgi:hypothetical protein